MGSLRQEILQSQQTRSDLLKWKLGLAGAIGAIGLGLAGSRVSSHADLVLCAVPLVSVYVDLLCRHLSLRILVIGTFFHSQWASGDESEAAVLRRYEDYVHQSRTLTTHRPVARDPQAGDEAEARDSEGSIKQKPLQDQKGGSAGGPLARAIHWPERWVAGDAFALEDLAVSGSTIVLSLAVFAYGAFVLAGSSAAGAAFILSGTLGLLTSYFCHLAYTGRRTSLVDLAKQSAS